MANSIKCTIEGVVPIMFCRFPLPKKPGDKTKKKPQTLEEKVWVDEKGMYIPADNLRQMLIGNKHRTGAAMIYGSHYESKKGKKYIDFCKACVWVVGCEDDFNVYFKPNRKTWDDTDIRSFINVNGGRDITERPLIKTPWSLTFIIHVTDDSVQPDTIRAFYDVAGTRCGLGVYGPTFGRFIVTEWEVLEEKKKAS